MNQSTLYFGGTIRTCDKKNPTAEALLTENGRILSLGSKNELLKLRPDAVPFDLEGKTLIPGFVDGHSHLSGVGASFRKCDLTQVTSFDEMLQCISDFREKRNLTHGEVIICRGYDPEQMKEKRHPDRFVLDRLDIENPVFCYHVSGHMLACNTNALDAAAIPSDYEVPEGGFAGKGEDGTWNGYFEEIAKTAVTHIIPQASDEDVAEDVLSAIDHYAASGFTTVQDGSQSNFDRYLLYLDLAKKDLLKLDTVIYLSFGGAKKLVESKMPRKFGRLKVGGIKIFLDGSPQAKTAWMSRPYEGEKSYCGYPTMSDDKVLEAILYSIENELQIIAHCNGDAASEQFLSLWEKAVEKYPEGIRLRPVMIHAQTVREDQLVRMKKCGMMASFFVGHCHYWGDTHLKNLGERAYRISPAGTALRLGIPFSFHQDSPVTQPDMLFSIYCAVNRKTKLGVLLSEDDRVSVEVAFFAATVGGAYEYFDENEKGVLSSGCLADFVILESDPISVEMEDVGCIRVLKTIKEDRVVYTK